MRPLTLLLAAIFFCTSASAQKDTTTITTTVITIKKTTDTIPNDTIRIGSIIIVKRGDGTKKTVTMGRKTRQRKQLSNVSTNWGIVDLGFSNYDDQTNYANAGNYLVNRPGSPTIGKGDLSLKTGKSINVNIWIVMQKLNLVKHNLNLKYGLGLELNNYRYKQTSPLSYKEGGAVPYTNTQVSDAFIFRDSITFSKNKLAADYLTVPFMLNFQTNPNNNKRGITISAGVSAGYLYSQRNKQKSDERGKEKNKGEYDLERFKFSYIAELGLGPVRLYGSYSPKSIYERGLDVKPYNVGIRLSAW